MRTALFTVFSLLISTQAFALTAEWIRNTDSDMKEYRMYLCEGKGCAVQQATANIAGTIVQPAVGVVPTWPVPNAKVGAIAVSAVDTSGNESPLSNTVTFDTVTPGTPSGLTIKLSVDVRVIK